MIRSYDDYLRYLEADRISLNVRRRVRTLLFDDIYKYQRLMRKLEYLLNCNKNRLRRLLVAYRYKKMGLKLGFTIPVNIFGPGLSIAHCGTIVVNEAARIGSNCRLHACVNIGTMAGRISDAPKIGDNCYIGPGAKIFGPITIGDNVTIGANAVVNKSFPGGNATIGGIPAKIISHKGSEGLIRKGAATCE